MCCIHETEPLDAFAVAARRLYYSHSIRIVLQSCFRPAPKTPSSLLLSPLVFVLLIITFVMSRSGQQESKSRERLIRKGRRWL